MANGNFGGGDGTEANPYLVEDAHDLDAIRNYLGNTSVYFKQVANIDLSSWENWNPIYDETAGFDGMFCGNYDGNGFKISNMTCHHDDIYYVGLFGAINSATLKNIFIENCDVIGDYYVGVLAASAETSTISNCHASGNVSGYYQSGGLIGFADSCTTSNCYANSNVNGHYQSGGLIGAVMSGTISNCYANGSVSGYYQPGGLIGAIISGAISNCYANGNINGSYDVGGLIGYDSESTISNCYASGGVNGEYSSGGLTDNIGGLTGFTDNSTISNCYALNSFITVFSLQSDTCVGDIVGDYSDSTIENCYSLDTLDEYISKYGERQGTPITKQQAKRRQTYSSLTGWDMESVWFIKEGVSYPELIKRSDDVEWGEPGTHYMTYRYVIPHVDGTAQWGGVKWLHQKIFYQYPNPPAVSPIGTLVTYEVGNLEQRIFVDRYNKEVDLVFIFSGVKDFKGAAGYAHYTDELVRTVEVHPERAAVVNFYFTEPRFLPTTNYKLSVSTPEGVVDVTVVAEPSTSPIRFVADTGEIWAIPLVDTDDEKATPVHVATDDGIKAFKQYEPFGEIKMLEGDEWKWE